MATAASGGAVFQLQLHLEENASKNGSRRVENTRNCDIFVDEHVFLIYADVVLLKMQTTNNVQLDVKRMKQLTINFNTKERRYEALLPTKSSATEPNLPVAELGKQTPSTLNLWKLKRITDECRLKLDTGGELLKFDANFHYGFAGSSSGKLQFSDSDLSAIVGETAPHLVSPLQRSINREIDELKNFSREEYKSTCIELDVPEGHDNPMNISIDFDDSKLSREEECLLHNLTRQTEDLQMPPEPCDLTEIDCGLISILLAICYDVRSTSNEPTCESAWTRSILSATLSHFEPFDSVRDVVISFMRRSLIYPLYRNFDYARLCVQDAIDALHKSSTTSSPDASWILKHLLATHELFESSDCSRAIFNRYYIAPYIRYLSTEANCAATHLQLLARNLKNILLDLLKQDLRLELVEIETELLQELVTDMPASDEDSDDNSEGDDDCETESDDDDDDDFETSSASESEENSVIEQRLDALKITN